MIKPALTASGLATSPAVAYCHGFLSSALSSKGRFLKNELANRLGLHVRLLNLNGANDDPSQLSPVGALNTIDGCARTDGKLLLIGSSFGGWAAAKYAERFPQHVSRLLLLNPGFELGSRWEHIVGGAAELDAWKRERVRTFTMPSSGAPVDVPYAFVEDTMRIGGTPTVKVPTVVIHGTRDEVVPLSLSERFVNERCTGPAELLAVDDDHALTDPRSLEIISDQAVRLCEDVLQESAGGQGRKKDEFYDYFFEGYQRPL